MKIQKFNHSTVIALLASLVIILQSGCTFGINGIKGNGEVVKQERKVEPFSGVDVGGAFKVFLTQGDAEKLVVEADANLLDVITTEVRGNTLTISTNEEINDPEALNIYITFKTLEEMEISGACKVTAENTFKLTNLDLDCSGASDAELRFSVENLKMDCSGASKIELFGSAGSVSIDVSGASSLEAIELEAGTLEADVSGASNVKISVSRDLSAEVSGAACLKYKGDPSIKDFEVSGAASLKKY
jgi:hypothetical protein